jgi:hypothetical protein
MGLFKIFTPKADPILAWKTESGLVADFEFDFDLHALCGIKINDPVSLLWKLGPSEEKGAEANGDINYFSKGVQVSAENGTINSFVLFWNDDRRKQFLAFNGVCRFHGQKIELAAGISESGISKIFGEPYWRDEDNNEIILFYEFGAIEWQIEISRQEGLAAIVVLTPPLLADEAQRAKFKVTKPWPAPVTR